MTTKKKEITEKQVSIEISKVVINYIKKTKQPLMVYNAIATVKEFLADMILKHP